MGYEVYAIKRHPPTAQKKYLRAFQFGYWMCIDTISLVFKLAFHSRKDTITLYMGFVGSILVPLEFKMSCITRFFKYKNKCIWSMERKRMCTFRMVWRRCMYPFANTKFYGLKEYDKYLSQLYGDYLTPPKGDKHIHLNNIYWR